MTNLTTIQEDINSIETIIEEAAQEGITLDSIDAQELLKHERNPTASFDDLSHLLRVQYCKKIVVYFDHPCQTKIKMSQDYYDLQEGRVKFLTYIGGHSRDELRQIIKDTKAPRYRIRKAKRVLGFPLELKVSGYPFATMKALVNQFQSSGIQAIPSEKQLTVPNHQSTVNNPSMTTRNKHQQNTLVTGDCSLVTVKAISLHQPWASLIAMGIKHYETRSWSTNYRGQLVICSAKKNTKQQRLDYKSLASILDIDFTQNSWDSLPLGKAIATCDLTDCIKMTPEFIEAQSEDEQLCGHWEHGRFAWKLDDISLISPPVPIKGQQGLWDVQLPLLFLS
ncbi:ASCH domain-containing protein [Crocosphaera sp. Alani8]|uniref:ASCH domain-containing protein n=1 Tax=Crocosphaera sp. Alani8 TaxID=3038952 RepID=UPI00313BCC92